VETKNPSSKLDKGQLCRIQLSVSSLNRIGHKTVSQIMAWLAQQELQVQLGLLRQQEPLEFQQQVLRGSQRQEPQRRNQLLELQGPFPQRERPMELGLGCSQLARNP